MTKEITLTGKITLEDKEAREMLSILETRIATINERTKLHTLDIRELRKEKNVSQDKGVKDE